MDLLKILLALTTVITWCHCKPSTVDDSKFEFRGDLRWREKYYSIYINKQGAARVVKGNSTSDDCTLIQLSSYTSDVFYIDSAETFFKTLNKVRKNPKLRARTTADCPRAELYYKNMKFFDGNSMSSVCLNLYGPIMVQIPDGFNPFRYNDHPFE